MGIEDVENFEKKDAKDEVEMGDEENQVQALSFSMTYHNFYRHRTPSIFLSKISARIVPR